MRALILIFSLAFLLFAMPLRESDADYLLAAVFAIAVAITCLLKLRLPITRFDLGWLIALAFSLPPLFVALIDGVAVQQIAFQSLIFFAPVVALAPRLTNWQVSDVGLSRLALLLCGIKAIAYAPFFQEFSRALLSIGERERFHDFSGIIVAIFLIACLTAGLFRNLVARYVVLVCAVLLIASAAHRSLYIAVFAQMLFVFIVSSSPRQKRIAIVAGGIFVAALLTTPFGATILQLLESAVSGGDANASARINLSSAVWRAAFDFPLGHGFRGYFAYGVDNVGEMVVYALQHNSYLTYLYYVGWVPFLSMSGTIVYVILISPKVSKSELAMASSIFGMSIFAYFNMFLENPIYAVFYWMMFGFLVKAIEVRGSESAKKLSESGAVYGQVA